MSRTLYLIAIGISEYGGDVPNLKGCTNDVKAVVDFFQGFAGENGLNYSVHAEAELYEPGKWTRATVMDAFSHFSQAGEGDICVLYYSGHGSQTDAPPQFWDVETDHKCETMVCYDSRLPGGRDLLDKEIAYLLHKHSRQAGHTLVLFDSCHSGAITREVADTAQARMADQGNSIIRFEDLEGHTEYLPETGPYRHPVKSDHVTLSACRDRQVAYERDFDDVRRGVFTKMLLDTLQRVDLSDISYRELAGQVNTRVANYYNTQEVQFDAQGQASKNQRFLGGLLERDRRFVVDYDKTEGVWFLPQGAVNGMRVGTRLEVDLSPGPFRSAASTGTASRSLRGPKERGDGSGGKGEDVKILRVEPGRSIIAPHPSFAPAAAPYAVLKIDKITEPFTFHLGDGVTEEMEAQLQQAPAKKESIFLARTQVQCKYEVAYVAGHLTLRAVGEERPLCKRIAKEEGWEILLADRLAKVANYERTLTHGPRTGRLNLEKEVEIVLEQVFMDGYGDVDESLTEVVPQDGSGVFAYRKKNGKGELRQPRMRLSVQVKGGQYRTLHVGMLYFDEAFGIYDEFLPVDEIKHDHKDPYKTHFYYGSPRVRYNYLPLELPAHLVTEWGVTEIVNHVKVIVSEEEFSTSEFFQNELEQEPQQEMVATSKGVSKTKVVDKSLPLSRWNVKDISFTIQRSAELSNLPAEKSIAITSPDGLHFETALLESMAGNGTAEGSRSADAPRLPADIPFTEPVELMVGNPQNTRSTGSQVAIDSLKLCNVQGAEAVSPENPLRIQLNEASKSADGDELYVFAYDEELQLFYPVGHQADSGEVVIEYLPAPQPDELTRSLGGAIKLFFRKVKKLRKGKLERGDMRRVDISPDGVSTYREGGADAIKTGIGDLQVELKRPLNIALFIHGITGDTTEMPGILARAKDPEGVPLAARYDLVLTFDYESLNTRIMNTAEHLLFWLKKIGLTPEHPHNLDLFAHSMGGLVSRCLIERLYQGAMVRRLVQFGTPNAGSPLVYAHGGVVLVLSQLLGSLFPLKWFLAKTSVAAKELQPGSEFMLHLADGTTETPPYYLVNGDVTQREDYKQNIKEKVDGILQRFSRFFDRDAALTRIFFRGEGNDAIVSLASQQALLAPAIHAEVVACDHMSYFQSPEAAKGLEVIFRAIDENENN